MIRNYFLCTDYVQCTSNFTGRWRKRKWKGQWKRYMQIIILFCSSIIVFFLPFKLCHLSLIQLCYRCSKSKILGKKKGFFLWCWYGWGICRWPTLAYLNSRNKIDPIFFFSLLLLPFVPAFPASINLFWLNTVTVQHYELIYNVHVTLV